MTMLDLFSGIGGFAKGIYDAGYKIDHHYFSEIDKHPIANYKYNFKEAKNVGSVTDVHELEHRPNIITFGSPCQDFSVAGKRSGMAGERSSLISEAIRIIGEQKPDVFIWENVKGAYSSNDGSDFWGIIQAFTNIGGYRLEWQLLNTSWFLPQNRERIYLIGHLAGVSEPGVFPLFKTNGKDNKRNGNQIGVINDNGNLKQTELSTCLDANYHKGMDNHGQRNMVQIAHISRTDEAKAIRKESIKKGKDYSPFQEKKIEFKEADIMNTITCATQKDNLIKVNSGVNKGYEIAEDGDCIDFQNSKSKTRKGRVSKGKTNTLNTSCSQGILTEMKNANCLTPDAYLTKGERKRDEDGKAVLTSMHERRIRRLTPTECERLQGFPDGWTKYGIYDGELKEISKTQRYSMCGNAVTKNVVQAVIERLNVKGWETKK